MVSIQKWKRSVTATNFKKKNYSDTGDRADIGDRADRAYRDIDQNLSFKYWNYYFAIEPPNPILDILMNL